MAYYADGTNCTQSIKREREAERERDLEKVWRKKEIGLYRVFHGEVKERRGRRAEGVR